MTISKACRGARWVGVLLGVTVATAVRLCAETVVLPVVARGLPGLNGSFWDSEVRISGPNLLSPGRIKRLWVALPGGGFVDDPAAAPGWQFPTIACPGFCFYAGIVVLTGDQLLQGVDASKGAVALEIEGTGNHVFLHNSNTLGQPRLPQDAEGPACCLPGNGQLIRGLTESLVGQGFIPWITAGRSPYRVSVGLINPTGVARSFGVTVVLLTPFAGSAGTYWLGNQYQYGTPMPTLTIDLQPWGFRQVDDLASVLLPECPSCTWQDRVTPAAIYLVDNDNAGLPFYAYASVIWTPLNDPEFVAAEPYAQ
ncbi:MAG: hypothetical protein PHQ91_07165 [Thermoanaerobaculaceae bacterium]|nr:hypothetical protein [Thermoanaerobaculaceae bacterium]